MTKETTQACDRCGQAVTKRHRTGRPSLCRPCAAKAVEDAANQMAERSGPAWDRWVASMAGVAAKAAGGNL